MRYSIVSILREPSRFLPAIMIVAACSTLLGGQVSIFMGLLWYHSKPIALSEADLWVSHAMCDSFDSARPIPYVWRSRLLSQPEISEAEVYTVGVATLVKINGELQQCMVVGMDMDNALLGAENICVSEQRKLLMQGNAVVTDYSDSMRFESDPSGFIGEVAGTRVKCVGYTTGLPRLSTPYMFCTTNTANRLLLQINHTNTTFVIGKCRVRTDVQHVLSRLKNEFPDMKTSTKDEFIKSTRLFWFAKTKAGTTIALVAVLGTVVGLLVTSQTLYAATISSRKEFAVLEAMGIPKSRVGMAVLYQSFLVGLIGIAVSIPFGILIDKLLSYAGVLTYTNLWIWLSSSFLALTTAVLSGIFSLRSLKLVEPAELLH